MDPRVLDQFLFIALPYVCLFTFFLMTIYRYRTEKFSYSSLSSQFLENRQHFFAVVPFHYGILAITLGHFIAFLVPRSVLAWNSHPLRLYILELSALAFGLLTLIGLISIIMRRGSISRIREVTTTTDWVLFVLLTVQTILGISIAVIYPWGSSWFATVLAPYLWSIFLLNPDISYLAASPLLVSPILCLRFSLSDFSRSPGWYICWLYRIRIYGEKSRWFAGTAINSFVDVAS